MRRFVVRIIIFCGLVWLAMAACSFLLCDKSAQATQLGAEINKQSRLRTIEGGRIVFIGGSNLACGLDSLAIESAVGMPVVNLGLHAGLGFVYHVNAAKNYIHSGDIVCLVPEYSHFKGGTAFGDMELLILVLDVMPEQQSLLSLRQWLHLMQYIPDYAPRKLRRILETLVKGPPKKVARYNEQGDFAERWIDEPLSFPVIPIGGLSDYNSEVVVFIKSAVKSMESKGATVLLIPSVLQRRTYEVSRPLISHISDEFKSSGIPYVCSPEEFVLENKYFSDTPYHLNERGIIVRTKKMIELLRSCMDGKPRTALLKGVEGN